MPQSPSRPQGRDSMLRSYIDRHAGFVIALSFGYAVISCLALVLAMGIYTVLGGGNPWIVATALGLWLLLNAFGIHRFLRHLYQRAEDEYQHRHMARLKPLMHSS